MKLDIVKLDQELRENNIRPLYIIVGEENYLAHSSLKRIEKSIFGNESNELARTVLDGQGFSQAAFLQALQSMPMFGNKTLVIVRDADKISKEKLENLLPHLEKISSATTAIFMAAKLDGRSRFMQVCAKNIQTAIIECKPLYANQVASWINMEMRHFQKQIAQDAAGFLADIVGSDLGQLMQAMERISLFVGLKKLVELADVEEAIAETTQRSVFELTDAIGNKDKARALSVLHNLMEYGASPVLILNMIARHFRILIKAKEVIGKGSERELASYLGVNSFFVRNYLNQAQKYSITELKAKFSDLCFRDRQIKSSRLPRERILEQLIIN
ncbi:MAG: DNA polymerase III subunit delta [Pseudomonadota bacterium]